jgi:nucleotide-binding universal stress UspA family protein
MYSKIIVGHDLHEGGEDALALGKLIANATGAKLVVAGVFPFGALPHGFEASWREEEVKIASEIDCKAESVGAEPEAFPAPSPAHGLRGLAEEIRADLIVVGSSRHSSLGQVLAGNVGLGLLHASPCAVAIAPRGYRDQAELTTIAVGFDGSEESALALRDAVELGRATAAGLRIVAVAEPPPIVYGKGGGARAGWQELKNAIEEQLREQLDEALRSIPDGVAAEATLASGDPVVALADAGRTPGTLLFLGSRGYGPVRLVLLGSVSSALVRSAPCPMIVYPRGVQPAAATAKSAQTESIT